MDKIKELRKYMEMKYGKNYMTAIAKLSVPNPYDEHGIIKSENLLTSEEKDALKFYVPETAAFIEDAFLSNNDRLKDLSLLELQKIGDLTISDETANNIEYPDLEDKPKSS